MEREKRQINVIGINSYEFCEMPSSLQKMFIKIKNIAIPIQYADKIKLWFDKKGIQDKQYFLSKSDKNLISWIKATNQDLIVVSRGDPLWFGIGRILVENFSNDELNFYPSQNCVQLAFSKLKRPWHEVETISIHGREAIELTKALKSQKSNIAILTDLKNNGLELIKKNLIELSLDESYDFFICEELGFLEEKITKINLKNDFPEIVSSLNIVVLLKKQSTGIHLEPPLFGLADNIYKTFQDRPNLLTKREIRVQILADLKLPENGVIWDIGAGSGTIGLEALKLRPKLKLFSIDKRLGTKKLIAENAKILNVIPEKILEEDITKIIKEGFKESLKTPNRVIIGGCDKKTKILVIVELSKILQRGSIFVMPIISYEALQETKKIFEELNFKVNLNLIQTYKGLTISEGTRFEPSNPVFIISAEKR